MTSSSRRVGVGQTRRARCGARPTPPDKRAGARYSVRMPHFRLERSEPVWTLVFDRPPANAVDLELATALADAVADVAGSAECRGLVVTGAGRFFSAGIDVKAVPGYDAATRATM